MAAGVAGEQMAVMTQGRRCHAGAAVTRVCMHLHTIGPLQACASHQCSDVHMVRVVLLDSGTLCSMPVWQCQADVGEPGAGAGAVA